MPERLAATEYPIHDLLRRRWSPRAFADRPVERETLLTLFEAARWAPSSYNEQPWSFLVATKEEADDFRRMLACLVEANQVWARSAPVLVFPLARLTFSKNSRDNRHTYHDVGLAVGNLVTQATARGIACHQMAGIDVEKIRAEFEVPVGWDPVSAIAVGYLGDPATLPENLREREQTPSNRKSLRAILFSGHFGHVAPLVGPLSSGDPGG